MPIKVAFIGGGSVGFARRLCRDILSVAELARRVGWSENHFRTRFRRETGVLPGEFYLRRRVALARERLANTDVPLVWIALDLGFGSSQYMATCFRRITGRAPSSFRPPGGERKRRPRTRRAASDRNPPPFAHGGLGRDGAG